MTTELTEPARTTAPEREPSAQELLTHYRHVRETTERLCEPLEIEDYVVQSMPDASPVKWHLAHTSWFFETFVIRTAQEGRGISPDQYAYLFNSYYNALGDRIARPKRGLLSRPTVAEVGHYRSMVDEALTSVLEASDEATVRRLAPLVVLGCHHEQQHQELILTDLKHLFGSNPVRPSYREWISLPETRVAASRWLEYSGGLGEIGHDGGGFAFDNESPRHQVYNAPYRLADRLVTNREYLAFVEDGGYDRPEFWLSDGWNTRQAQEWTAPLYWWKDGASWNVFTLAGEHPLAGSEPVSHVSYYEADAFARWAGARLPTESEWERATESLPALGNFLESEQYHPRPVASGAPADGPAPLQLFGDVWEWTGSPYVPYPGYRPAEGALGEYNAKFMCNQMVLRGGSCATPRTHIRSTYRNFFPPDARWQFSGIRLAQDDR